MRPTHLTIEGLTAFRNPQEIKFGDLDLFAITGPTGAGKTSILDAITFALYGNICRVKGGQLRDLISHGSTHVKVSLDFRINGTTYRIARRLKKSGGGHEVQFVRIEGDHEVSVSDAAGVKAIDKSIEVVVGLDFSAFTKAVLLPQGAFHEFLKGDASARRQILITLLDLHRYLRAGAKAREQAKLLGARLDERAKLIESEYGDATPEALKSVKEAEKAAKAAYKQLQDVETKAKGHVANARAAEAIASAALGTETTFRQLESDVADYANELVPLREHVETRKRTALDAAKAMTSAEKRLGTAQTALAKVIENVGDEASLARLQVAAKSHKSEEATLFELDQQRVAAATEVRTAGEAHAAAVTAAKEVKIARGLTEQAALAAKTALERNSALLEYARAAAEEDTARVHLEAAAAHRDTGAAAAEDAAEHLRHLERADLAATLRVGLKAGDSCPVCESTIATLPRVERGAAAVLKKAREGVERADQKRLEAERVYAAARAVHGGASTRLVSAKAALPSGTKSASVDEAERLYAEAEAASSAAEKQLATAEQARTDADKQVTEADARRREAKAKSDGIGPQIVSAKKRLARAEADLRAAFPTKLPADFASVLDQRLEQVTQARQGVASAAEHVKTAQEASSDAITKHREAERLLADFAKRFAETKAKAELSLEGLEQLTSVALPPLPESGEELDVQVKTLTSSCPDYIEAAQAAARDGANSRDRAVRALASLLSPLELAPEANLGDVLESVAAKREEQHAEAVRAASVVTLLKDRITNRAELQQEIKEDTVRCVRFRTLGHELHQDKFIAYVLVESMERLAGLASVELLRISGERYSLVAEDDGFDVIDHHNADEHRSVATLSGGETFLASLALALALAGSVRDLAGTAAAARLDAIFIDEGFGALDPETLDVVVDALERLREGERMVGVISHVDALAERIPQGLVVSKNGGISTVAPR